MEGGDRRLSNERVDYEGYSALYKDLVRCVSV